MQGSGNDDRHAGAAAPPLDGTVTGTAGNDFIDYNYPGDPQGDRIDHGDAILAGEAGNDDLVYAQAGNDIVIAADGNDEVYGGAGDDWVKGGVGDDAVSSDDGRDTVWGGAGRDTVFGGDGDDVIDSSDGGIGLFDNPYPPLPADREPLNDRDLAYGGAGDDAIRTGDDRDTVFGGTGNDTIDAGIDDDRVSGDAGDDTIVGGEGNDTIDGGEGSDVIYGGLGPAFPDGLNIPDDAGDLVADNGRDTIFGGDGNDTIFGLDDRDTVFGGTGGDTIDGGVDDDVLFGGSGNDAVQGGQGDDVVGGDDGDDVLGGGEGDDAVFGDAGDDAITGGAGADALSGGADRDLFLGGTSGDAVDGGADGNDFDTLDLSGSGVASITYTSADREDGIVTFRDGTTMTFVEIENVIPCFTPGTAIATPRGERLVEELREGDRVITRDNGIQEIRWVGRKEIGGRALMAAPHLRPVLVKAGSLGKGLPERDMLVSPNHRILVSNDRTQLYFEESEVLAAAKHMTGTPGIQQVDAVAVTYIHFMFDRHEVVLSNGSWTESFQPGDWSLKGIGNAQRAELFELFPELRTREGVDGFQAARKALKRHEALLLAR